MSNILTIGEKEYNLDDYEYIHIYNFSAMLGWIKKIGLIKKSEDVDIMKHANYDWILNFEENRGTEPCTDELLANRELFKQACLYLESHPEKHVLTRPNGACGCYTKKFVDEDPDMQEFITKSNKR